MATSWFLSHSPGTKSYLKPEPFFTDSSFPTSDTEIPSSIRSRVILKLPTFISPVQRPAFYSHYRNMLRLCHYSGWSCSISNKAYQLSLCTFQYVSLRQLQYPACNGGKGTRYTLIVSDDGAGIPEKIDLKISDTLGLQLVSILVDQLDSKTELKRNGTEFIIEF